MPLWSLTHEKVEAMKKQLAEKTAEYEELLKITTEVRSSSWVADGVPAR